MKTNILAIVLLALTPLLATANDSTDHPHRGIDDDPAELFFKVLKNDDDDDVDSGIHIYRLCNTLNIEEETAHLMEVADTDDNLCLSKQEFVQFLGSENYPEFINTLFPEFRGNSGGNISMDKFIQRMDLEENDQKKYYWEQLFLRADNNKDGEINSDDLFKALNCRTEATNPDNSTPT
ncbi:hypothetical protein IWQ61_009994 [Dispira simplex]|nr:hypothetical protein IWQ61_009994 [Dispira simplex]